MNKDELELQHTFVEIIGGLKNAMRHTIKAQGLSLSPLHYLILKGIQETDNCTANLLAESMVRDKGQITRLIKETIDQELVDKTPNPNDKRSQYLRLTQKGKEYYQMMKKADEQALKQMRAEISDEDLHQFLTLGKQMSANLRKISENT